MLIKNARMFAVLALMLPVTGCASDPAVNVTAKECAYDFPLLPDSGDIMSMSDSLALSIDAHDALYDRHCANEGKDNE